MIHFCPELSHLIKFYISYVTTLISNNSTISQILQKQKRGKELFCWIKIFHRKWLIFWLLLCITTLSRIPWKWWHTLFRPIYSNYGKQIFSLQNLAVLTTMSSIMQIRAWQMSHKAKSWPIIYYMEWHVLTSTIFFKIKFP